MEYTNPAPLMLKAVSAEQRTIDAYASTWDLDRQGDRIQPGAFAKSIAGKPLAAVSVLVGHRAEMLPVGVPLELREDHFGLFTKTKVFESAAGNDLLTTAKELLAAGGSLGLSIGYQPRDYAWAQEGGRSVRVLKEIELMEFSFLSSTDAAANPYATVQAVKRAPLTREWRELLLIKASVLRREVDRLQADLDTREDLERIYKRWCVR